MTYNVYARVLHLIVFFFFFQAEDGIRDWSVTGVQTCALPIYRNSGRVGDDADPDDAIRHLVEGDLLSLAGHQALERAARRHRRCGERSEERRVGKECRSGWARDE